MRAGLDALQLEQAGNAVAERVLTVPELAVPTAVGCYLSVRKELPTGSLIVWLQSVGHRIAVPRVVDSRDMEFRKLQTPLEPGVLGIPTSGGTKMTIQVAICPGLAFDPRGGRLGYGAGYYDRWLSKHPTVIPVGVCLDEAVLDEVPVEAHDRRMRWVVTPTRRIQCG
jgi:5-formyltetrahydrofolate cyclo-ligase